jgi:hypothetical protein
MEVRELRKRNLRSECFVLGITFGSGMGIGRTTYRLWWWSLLRKDSAERISRGPGWRSGEMQ